MPDPALSLIIPVGPDETSTPRLLESLNSNKIDIPSSWERIIASVQQNSSIDPPKDWRKVHCKVGRGRQLNQAAAIANGDWLWFIHADSLPDSAAVTGIEKFVESQDASSQNEVIGYCSLAFDSDGPAQTFLNAIGANIRSHLLGLPYGDQGYCISVKTFKALGGFREDLDRGEDLDFLVRAKHAGVTVRSVGGTILTSARRYQSQGWLKTTLAHQAAAARIIRAARASAEN